MSSVRLTFALLCIPRLFVALILFPLGISLLVVIVQLVLTAGISRVASLDSNNLENHYERRRDNDIGKRLVLGSRSELPPVRICHWEFVPRSNGELIERPISKDCLPDRLDVALHLEGVEISDFEPYKLLFNGWIERIHICKTCRPDTVISVSKEGIRSDTYSAQALLVLKLSRNNEAVQKMFVSARREADKLQELAGDIYFHSPGLRASVPLSQAARALAVIANIAGLVMVALWLALKSHRKVLDYFARNGALLPMVAATGQRSFYGSLWILTLLRVCAFLGAAVPLTLIGMQGIMDTKGLDDAFLSNPLELALWLTALISSFGLAALIASLSDLKHRHELFCALYKYVPLIFCLGGTVIWTFSFIFDGPLFGLLRSVLTAVPIIGMGPVLIAPALKPDVYALAVHAILTLALALLALRSNARWFAAHLEEL